MKTLSERLKWILANRKREDGSPWDAKSLSLAAGLGQNHVGQFIREKLKNPSTATARKLAAVAKVSVGWLADGEGTPDSADSEEPSRGESELPVHGNAVGFMDVVGQDRRDHPEVDDRYWQAAVAASSFLVMGPALPGDAYKLAKLAKELSEPSRLVSALREAQERVRALEAQQPQKAAEFRRKTRGEGKATSKRS